MWVFEDWMGIIHAAEVFGILEFCGHLFAGRRRMLGYRYPRGLEAIAYSVSQCH